MHGRLVALFAHISEDSVFWARTPHESLTLREKDRGRIETRTDRFVPVAVVLADRAEWTDLQSVGGVDATRHFVRGPRAETTEQHRRDVITSLNARVAPFAQSVRSHWQIENACHWALRLMRQDTTQTTGLKGWRLIAGWNPANLPNFLRIAFPIRTHINNAFAQGLKEGVG